MNIINDNSPNFTGTMRAENLVNIHIPSFDNIRKIFKKTKNNKSSDNICSWKNFWRKPAGSNTSSSNSSGDQSPPVAEPPPCQKPTDQKNKISKRIIRKFHEASVSRSNGSPPITDNSDNDQNYSLSLFSPSYSMEEIPVKASHFEGFTASGDLQERKSACSGLSSEEAESLLPSSVILRRRIHPDKLGVFTISEFIPLLSNRQISSTPSSNNESAVSIYNPKSAFNSQKIKCKNIDTRLAEEVGVRNYNKIHEHEHEHEKWVPPNIYGLENSERIVPTYYIPSNMNRQNVLRIDYHFMVLDDIRNLRPLNIHQLNYINNNLNESEKQKIIEEFNNVIKSYGEILLDKTS